MTRFRDSGERHVRGAFRLSVVFPLRFMRVPLIRLYYVDA